VRPCGASEWPPCKAGAGGGRPSARATSHSPRGVLWSQASGEGGASAAASLRHPAFQERMAPRASEGMENVQPKTSNQRRSPAAARSPGGCRPGRLCVVQRVVRRVRVHLHASTRQQLRKRHHLLRASTSAPCRLCFAAARVGHRPCPGSARVVRETRCRDAEGSAATRPPPGPSCCRGSPLLGGRAGASARNPALPQRAPISYLSLGMEALLSSLAHRAACAQTTPAR
jgi:hypothetical protein